jgi:hypothetical protein
LVALLTVVGCHLPFVNRPDDTPRPLLRANVEPTATELVAYLNDNARKVPGLYCKLVYMDAKQGNRSIGMVATMACERSRNFRMKAVVGGQPAADFGSNEDEFWYWINQNEPPYVFHGKYADMGTARAQPPIPFQPDLVIDALGIGDYDPNAKYDVRTGKDYVELIEPSTSIQGKRVWKVTVFNRGAVTATKPQVVAYILKDAETGKDIAVATVTSAQVNRETGAVLPKSLVLTLTPPEKPDAKVEMIMKFENLQVKTFDQDQRGTMFALRDVLENRQGFDLVRGVADGAPAGMGTGMPIQRTNGTGNVPPPR